MTTMWIAASLALTAALVWWVSRPLLLTDAVDSDSDITRLPEDVLRDTKDRSLRALKDLEMDYAMGKLSRDDYERSRQTMSVEVASLLEQLKRHARR